MTKYIENLIIECIKLDMYQEVLVILENFGQGSIGSAFALFKKILLDKQISDNNTPEETYEKYFNAILKIIKEEAMITKDGYYPWIMKHILNSYGKVDIGMFIQESIKPSHERLGGYAGRFIENLEALVKFDTYKNKPWFEGSKDINSYKDFRDLWNTAKQAENENHRIEEEKKRLKSMPKLSERTDITTYLKNDRYTMILLNPEYWQPAKDYGADTWCWYNQKSYYNQYFAKGWLLIIQDNNPVVQGEVRNALKKMGLNFDYFGHKCIEIEDIRNVRDIKFDWYYKTVLDDDGRKMLDDIRSKMVSYTKEGRIDDLKNSINEEMEEYEEFNNGDSKEELIESFIEEYGASRIRGDRHSEDCYGYHVNIKTPNYDKAVEKYSKAHGIDTDIIEEKFSEEKWNNSVNNQLSFEFEDAPRNFAEWFIEDYKAYLTKHKKPMNYVWGQYAKIIEEAFVLAGRYDVDSVGLNTDIFDLVRNPKFEKYVNKEIDNNFDVLVAGYKAQNKSWLEYIESKVGKYWALDVDGILMIKRLKSFSEFSVDAEYMYERMSEDLDEELEEMKTEQKERNEEATPVEAEA